MIVSLVSGRGPNGSLAICDAIPQHQDFMKNTVLKVVFGLVLLGASLLRAEIRLPGFINDHMVLQREKPIPIWGWADPGEEITVALSGQSAAQTTADAAGRWKVSLEAMPAGGPHRLIVKGANQIEIEDVLVGEVWLCSGQSNMEWTVARSLNPGEEVAAAGFPQIRHLKVARKTSGRPLEDLSAQWQVCSPETARHFTAAGYFMARKLHRELDVPIGLINSSWGGTRIEPWTPIEGFEQVAKLEDILNMVSLARPDNAAYRQRLKKHIADSEAWLEETKITLIAKRPAPAFPPELNPLNRHTDPTALFNAMISPIVGYGMRGAIWYQGESNRGDGMLYHEKKKALVRGWRKIWGIGDFPFYYVQVAPYEYGSEDPAILARFWEAQSASLEIPNTGMIVTSDIGNVKDIHPKNKQEVGRRLALLALKNDYGRKDLVASGPAFESLKIEGDKIRVKFKNVAGGLKSRDGKPLTHFELIGEQAEFVKADAEIDGDSVVLSAKGVKRPAAMRFAWHKLAEPNLANGAGLPASAFRAGEIPDYDFLKLKVREADDYQLVYDLDLKKLGRDIDYAADNSKTLEGGFDRIAYFIELKDGSGLRYAYASMDAFTDDLSKIAIPTPASKAMFQAAVKNLTVVSNAKGVVNGANLAGGNIEFWPHNYGPRNAAKVKNASTSLWDFGDEPSDPVDGYGCMQVHNSGANQTVFAVNQWKSGADADLGIGNSSGQTRDWTFAKNARSFEAARLRVLVRLKK